MINKRSSKKKYNKKKNLKNKSANKRQSKRSSLKQVGGLRSKYPEYSKAKSKVPLKKAFLKIKNQKI